LTTGRRPYRSKLLAQAITIGDMRGQQFLQLRQHLRELAGVAPLPLQLRQTLALIGNLAFRLGNVTVGGREVIFKRCSVHDVKLNMIQAMEVQARESKLEQAERACVSGNRGVVPPTTQS
jgi:hypothetical protein